MTTHAVFPDEAVQAAEQYNISPALAFGLGEGLNLYYGRYQDQEPPHFLRIVPLAFAAKVKSRIRQPRATAIAEALAGNGYGVVVCTGDWHGLDAIEKWAEELSRWPEHRGWERSVLTFADLIEQTDGLYRRSYALFLDEAQVYYDSLTRPRSMLPEIADDWCEIAQRLRRGDDLARLGTRLLRMASRESRFWATILNEFGVGGMQYRSRQE